MKTLVLATAVVVAACVAACGGGSSGSGDTDAVPGDSIASVDAPPTTDGGCVATGAETCDMVDNDCNGLVDDVDEGGDGLYDCQTIALFGSAGANGSSNFVAWLESNGTDIVRIQDSTDGAPALTAAELDAHQVIILDRLIREYTDEEAALLTAWVTAGGGLMVLTGYSGGGGDFYANTLLEDIGLEYNVSGGLLSGPVTTFNPHPVTGGLTSVTFSGGWVVGEVAGVTGGTNTVVASIGAYTVGIVQQRGLGRVFVWGDEWITFDSEWTSMPEIEGLWANSLGWLGRFI